MSPITQIKQDPNIFLITIGAIIWLLGSYIPFVGPFFTVVGFGMTASAVAVSSLKRPTSNAIGGLLLGGIVQLVGYYLSIIPLINLIIAFPMIVLGGVMILYFAIPLAIQTGKVPFIEEIQAQIKREKESDSVEEPTEEETDEKEPIE
ncbi:MAG: hypothetical protein ACTSU3_02240 [Candidatus Thorarchaeota archaeon]